MKPTLSFLRRTLPALFLVLQCASASAAVSLGSDNLESASTTHEYQTDYLQWIVADLSDPLTPAPLEITTAAGSGYWTQTLTFPSTITTLTTGDTFDLQELVQFTGGDFALASWSQRILTPGWEWVTATIFDSDTSSEVAGLVSHVTGDTASFTFNPLGNGASLIVAAQLQYTGPGGAATPLSLQIIPEPGSAMLGLIGAVLLLRRRAR